MSLVYQRKYRSSIIISFNKIFIFGVNDNYYLSFKQLYVSKTIKDLEKI